MELTLDNRAHSTPNRPLTTARAWLVAFLPQRQAPLIWVSLSLALFKRCVSSLSFSLEPFGPQKNTHFYPIWFLTRHDT